MPITRVYVFCFLSKSIKTAVHARKRYSRFPYGRVNGGSKRYFGYRETLGTRRIVPVVSRAIISFGWICTFNTYADVTAGVRRLFSTFAHIVSGRWRCELCPGNRSGSVVFSRRTTAFLNAKIQSVRVLFAHLDLATVIVGRRAVGLRSCRRDRSFIFSRQASGGRNRPGSAVISPNRNGETPIDGREGRPWFLHKNFETVSAPSSAGPFLRKLFVFDATNRRFSAVFKKNKRLLFKCFGSAQ